MAWQSSVEQTVSGLGFDLVEIERSAGGLLRITIDMPYIAGEEGRFITVEDCEIVTRQLQFLLEVENVDYTRLEISSPGIDRLLRHDQDCQRFLGHVVDITLKAPIGAGVTDTGVSANRKKFRGTLEAGATQGLWQIVWSDAPSPKPGQRVSKKRAPAPLKAMQFSLLEVREARLAPIVDFKGRKSKVNPDDDDLSGLSGLPVADMTDTKSSDTDH
jgi:ribosome maturation factor RimP